MHYKQAIEYAMAGLCNPFLKDDENVTAQGYLINNEPSIAMRLMHEAGWPREKVAVAVPNARWLAFKAWYLRTFSYLPRISIRIEHKYRCISSTCADNSWGVKLSMSWYEKPVPLAIRPRRKAT